MNPQQTPLQPHRRNPGSKTLPQHSPPVSPVATRPLPHQANATATPQSATPMMIPRAVIEEARRRGITNSAQLHAWLRTVQRGIQRPHVPLNRSHSEMGNPLPSLHRTNSEAASARPLIPSSSASFPSRTYQATRSRSQKDARLGSKQADVLRARIAQPSEVTSHSEFEPESEDDGPSSLSNLRSAKHKKALSRRPTRQQESTPTRDAPCASIETPDGETIRVNNSRKRRVIQDPEDEPETNAEAFVALKHPRLADATGTPVHREYAVPEKLQSTRQAMGEADWKEYIGHVEAFVEKEIAEEELNKRERVLFQTEDRLRKRIRGMVLKMVSEGRYP